ncbi:MAG TPA: hypothetical protein VMF55_15095 [Solirubrobacterales bacterium]|nr:hypothetical protein [Solirubrobacterales bacterium]
MRAKAFAAVAAAVAVAALLLSGPAAARTGPSGRGHPTIMASFAVEGSNGFSVGVNLRNRSVLAVEAVSLDGPSIIVSGIKLDAPQAPGSDRIDASLGKFGRIAMRFIPETTREEEPLLPLCKGEMALVETGRFVGRFEFRGERGYTKARASRAFGSVITTPASTCHHSSKPAPHRRPPHHQGRVGATLEALRTARPDAAAALARRAAAEPHRLILRATTEKPAVKFEASRISGPGKQGREIAFDTFIAAATRDRGRIEEESTVLDLLIRGPHFQVPDLTHLTSEAVITPPAPFLGSATLRREPSSEPSWDGNLRLDLPGFGVVPLARPGTQVSICADSGCRTS